MIVSDIHGSLVGAKRLENLIDIYDPYRILVLGDILNGSYDGGSSEVAAILKKNKEKVIAVKGNCDFSEDENRIDNDLPKFVCFTFNGHSCHLQHHPFGGVNFPPGDILMNGHTHVKTLHKEAGVIHLNPGSLSYPRDGAASYIVMDETTIRLFNAETHEELNRIDL